MKKTSLLLLTAVTAAMLSSCGTSTYSVSNIEDGIYYRPSSADADGGWKEDRRISELKTRTASETGYGGSAQKSDTLYLSKGQAAAEIDYLPGKTYTVLLDETKFSSSVPDSLKDYYRININLNNYAYPYYYDWRWRWGFTFAWWPSYYDPWYHTWYWDPWYRPWYYDPWYRPCGPCPWYYDPWYRPYGPCPYPTVVYVDPRPLVRTHRGGEITGRSTAYSAGGRSVSGISGREGAASEGRSGASIQGRNVRASVSEGRQGNNNNVNRPAGSGDGVSQAVTARTNAAVQARANAANPSRESQQSHLSSSRAAYANYRPASSNAERRQQAEPESVNNPVSRSSQGFTSQRQGSSSSSVTYRRSGESVSGNGRSVGSSQRDSYSSSQRNSYSSSQSSSYSSQRSSYSSSSSSYSGGGGFSGGGGGGFSGGGGSRGGGGMRR